MWLWHLGSYAGGVCTLPPPDQLPHDVIAVCWHVVMAAGGLMKAPRITILLLLINQIVQLQHFYPFSFLRTSPVTRADIWPPVTGETQPPKIHCSSDLCLQRPRSSCSYSASDHQVFTSGRSRKSQSCLLNHIQRSGTVVNYLCIFSGEFSCH